VLTEYIVKLLSLIFIRNINQLSVTTVYMKINCLQCVFRSSLMTVIFFTVCVQTVIEVHRIFSAAFVNINLY